MIRCVSFVGRLVATALLGHFAWIGIGALVAAPAAVAQGQLIPMTGHREHQLDRRSGILYIATNRGTVERYNTRTEEFMTPFTAPSSGLLGLSLTSDGSRLFAADTTDGLTAGVVRVFDTASGNYENAFFTQQRGETGASDVAVTRGGYALMSTFLSGSGNTPLRAIDMESLTTSVAISSWREAAGMVASGDGGTVLLRSISGSPSELALYDVDSQGFAATRRAAGGLGPSINRDGTRIAAFAGSPFSMQILDRSLELVADLNMDDGWSAFSPTSNVLFITDRATRELVAIDLDSYDEIERYSIGEVMASVSGLSVGHMSFSGDGRTLYLSTPTGIRAISVIPSPGSLCVLGAVAMGWVPRRRHRRLCSSTAHAAGTAAALLAVSGPSTAHSKLLPIPDRVDHMIDHSRSVLYVTTTSGLVHRYDIEHDQMMDPIVLSATPLRGVDISPDGTTLYVADGVRRFAECRIWAIDLETESVRAIVFPSHRKYSVNVHEIVSTLSGYALLSVDSSLSREELYRLDYTKPETVTPVVGILGQDKNGLFRGGDIGNTIFFTEPNTSDGPVGVFAAELGDALVQTGSGHDVTTVVASVNHDETRIAVARGAIISVYDRMLQPVELLAGFGGGVAFSPSAGILFAADRSPDEIVVIDSTTYREISRICVGEELAQSSPLQNGVMSVTEDGQTLFVSSPSGIRRVEVGPPACEGDTNDDMSVNFLDLNAVLSAWGNDGASSPADVNRDCAVDFGDLNLVLSNWGRACE